MLALHPFVEIAPAYLHTILSIGLSFAPNKPGFGDHQITKEGFVGLIDVYFYTLVLKVHLNVEFLIDICIEEYC